MFPIPRIAVISVSLLLLAPQAVAAEYGFVNIADSRGPYDYGSFSPGAVSNTGAVAFISRYNGVFTSYVGDGAFTNKVVDLTPLDGFQGGGGGGYSLNVSGTAAGGEGKCCGLGRIQLYDATATRTIFELTDYHLLGNPSINNSGHVAFDVFSYEFGANAGVVRWFDGVSTNVVDATAGFFSIGYVGLNELGDVAFVGQRREDEVDSFAYYRTDGATLTLIADSSGPLNLEAYHIWPLHTPVNDSGVVALNSPLDTGGQAIVVGDGGPLTMVAIADPTTPFHSFEGIAINDQETVAFFARLWDGRDGIFTGPDPVEDKVIATGDFLFGQFVTSVGLSPLYINERGDIAFTFTVEDPRGGGGATSSWTGIALALNESVPEPATVALVAMACAVSLAGRWRKNNSGT